MLSCVLLTVVILSLSPRIAPHLAVYIAVFWAGLGLIVYIGNAEYLPSILLDFRADLRLLYHSFFN